jgi:hypothetical protein
MNTQPWWGDPRSGGRVRLSRISVLANDRIASEPLRRLGESTLMTTHAPIQAIPGGLGGTLWLVTPPSPSSET